MGACSASADLLKRYNTREEQKIMICKRGKTKNVAVNLLACLSHISMSRLICMIFAADLIAFRLNFS
jgi:hypothetical protein